MSTGQDDESAPKDDANDSFANAEISISVVSRARSAQNLSEIALLLGSPKPDIFWLKLQLLLSVDTLMVLKAAAMGTKVMANFAVVW